MVSGARPLLIAQAQVILNLHESTPSATLYCLTTCPIRQNFSQFPFGECKCFLNEKKQNFTEKALTEEFHCRMRVLTKFLLNNRINLNIFSND